MFFSCEKTKYNSIFTYYLDEVALGQPALYFYCVGEDMSFLLKPILILHNSSFQPFPIWIWTMNTTLSKVKKSARLVKLWQRYSIFCTIKWLLAHPVKQPWLLTYLFTPSHSHSTITKKKERLSIFFLSLFVCVCVKTNVRITRYQPD